MATQTRRGSYVNFDPDKLLPGEWASVLEDDDSSVDGTSIYICFKAGDVKRMATYEDIVQYVQEATSDVQAQFTTEMQAAIQAALTAAQAASEAKEAATAATTAANTATDAANEAAEKAEQYVLGDISNKTVITTDGVSGDLVSGESLGDMMGKLHDVPETLSSLEDSVNSLNTNLTTLENNAIKVAELSAPQSTVAANGAVSISCGVSTSRVVNAVWYAGGGSSGMVYVSFASGYLHFRNISGASYTPTSTHKIFVFYY